MNMPKKERARGRLWSLTEEQRAQLIQWLLPENRTYEQVVVLAKEKLGVNTNRTALCDFRQRAIADRQPKRETVLEILILVRDDKSISVKVLQ